MRAVFLTLILWFFCTSAYSQPTSLLFEEAYKFMKAKKYDEAIGVYTAILKLDDKSADAYLNRGLCYFNKKDFESSAKDLKKAANLLPDNAEVELKLGNTYYEQQDYKTAITHYDKAILKNPSFAEAYNSRGICHQMLGNYRQALSDYNTAILHDPKMYAAYNNRGAATYYNQSIAKAHRLDIESAIKDFTTALDLNPLFCMAYKNRALAYSFLKKYDEANKDAESAVNCSSQNYDNWLTKGSIEVKSGRYAEAIKDLRKSLEINENQAEAVMYLSEAYMLSGDYGEAEETVNQALILDKNFKPLVCYRLAQIAGYQQNKEMAIYNLDKANSAGYFTERDNLDSFLKDKAFENFRKDPEFKKIVEKIKK